MNEEWLSRLREHDPAAGKSLSAFDRTRMLQHAKRGRRPRLVLAFALLALLVAIALPTLLRQRRVAQPVTRYTPSPVRQIQCATPGGTRIVWTLDPDFRM